jgi:asparagine synthetase B (glutamine-hydrolysing)
MVPGSEGPPALFGAVTLDGTPLPPPPSGAAEVMRRARVCLFRVGALPELHVLDERPLGVALVGRILEPVRVRAGAPEADALRQVAAADPLTLHGSFALLRVDGEADVRMHTDRYGLRPLFYRTAGGLLLFSTHLRGLCALAPPDGIDEGALLHYYNFGVTPNDRTLLRGVRKVAPGRTVAAEGGAVRERDYFTVAALYEPARFAACGEGELAREVDHRLARAVARRTGGEAAVGIALSGGVDSGLLAAKAAGTGARVVGYTLAYGASYNEFARIDFLSRALSLEVRRITLGAEEVIRNFEHASGMTSEPVGFNNATMRFAAAAAAADGIRTLLDGDGADRLFLGMSRYRQYARLIRAHRVLARLGLVAPAARILGVLPWREARKIRLHFENWRRGMLPYSERGLGDPGPYDEAYERRVYDLAVAPHRESFRREIGEGDFGLFFTWLAVRMCPELFFHHPAELQQELGVFAVPAFWDDDVVAIAVSLPTAWKLRHGQTKYILRKAARLSLDAGYWQLPKIGLQSAYSFAVASPEGQAWRRRRVEEARASPEAAALAEAVPRGALDAERLLPVVVWKERLGLRG